MSSTGQTATVPVDTVPLQARYEIATSPVTAPDAHVLAQIRFGAATACGQDPRLLELALPPLAEGGLLETWRCPEVVRHGWRDGIGYAQTPEVLFFQLLLAEPGYPSLEAASADAYRRLLLFLADAGYPHLLRVWNYFPRINQGEGESERYQQFCVGRGRM
ncbi:MAG: hypothetical protein ACRES4_10680, partial [Nevskiales bacterium]